MLSWLPLRRAKTEQIDAEAEALISDFGIAAYSEARRREQEASSDPIAQVWALVAAAVAQKTGRSIGPDASIRMAKDAVFAPEGDPSAVREQRSPRGIMWPKPRCSSSGSNWSALLRIAAHRF